MNDYYKEIIVWKRVGEKSLKKFVCFELLSEKKFCVQSIDFYHMPIDYKNLEYQRGNFYELLCEEKPEERSGLFDTLEEAILDFENNFL